MGKIRKIRPRDRILMFATRDRMPWENSWRMIATARPRIPYPTGMIGLMPGRPRSVSGGGGFPRIAALCTRVASQAKRTVVPTIVSATRRIATSPKIRQKRLGDRLARSGGRDQVVDPPQLPLLDHDLFLAGRQEAFLLEHVEHVAVRDIQVVVDRFRLESEERHEVVGEGPQVVLGHPSLPNRCPEGGDHLGHRDNGHENVASHVDYKIKGRRTHSCS